MEYIAHINESSIQTVKEHCQNTANLSASFAIPALKNLIYNIGLLHDIGKYQNSFQNRIRGKKVLVEHSGAGAFIAVKNYPGVLGYMMAECIAGHHSGIPNLGNNNDSQDMTSLCGRLKRNYEDFSIWNKELQQKDIDSLNIINCFFYECKDSKAFFNERYAFLTRYCFSCITDADSIDTGNFCGTNYNKELKTDFKTCLEKINNRLANFKAVTELQKARALLQKQVYNSIYDDANIYFMNMPTGSGKTLCSVKCALEMAQRLNKKRIIYVIPFNSIIDQTVEEFEKVFGSSAEILRHQSTFSYDKKDELEDYRNYAKLSAENWNASFIITTAVQFFESLASNKRGRLRKLHNMADSILIFDEVHMLPIKYLQPCLQAIQNVTELLNSKAILLTATMPDYSALLKKCVHGKIRTFDLVRDKRGFVRFKKCSYHYLGEQSDESIVQQASRCPTSLIIVNRRKAAKEIYKLCTGKKFHLSTYMTAYDRQRIIAEIKAELMKLEDDYPGLIRVPDERKIIVISTSLIEAGVDLDFYTVFRELSGLDSILQAGGRCNREGKRSNAKVYVYSSEYQSNHIDSDTRANIAKGIFNDFEDIGSDDAIKAYYDRLYSVNQEEITSNAIGALYTIPMNIDFVDYAEKFRMIDSNMVSIVVARDEESKRMIADIEAGINVSTRKLQRYSCSIYHYEVDELLAAGVLNDFDSGILCLTNLDYYDENLGIQFEGKDYIIEEGGFIL